MVRVRWLRDPLPINTQLTINTKLNLTSWARLTGCVNVSCLQLWQIFVTAIASIMSSHKSLSRICWVERWVGCDRYHNNRFQQIRMKLIFSNFSIVLHAWIQEAFISHHLSACDIRCSLKHQTTKSVICIFILSQSSYRLSHHFTTHYLYVSVLLLLFVKNSWTSTNLVTDLHWFGTISVSFWFMRLTKK